MSVRDLMTRQFCDGLIGGFLVAAMIVGMAALWWVQDRSITRAATPSRVSTSALLAP